MLAVNLLIHQLDGRWMDGWEDGRNITGTGTPAEIFQPGLLVKRKAVPVR